MGWMCHFELFYVFGTAAYTGTSKQYIYRLGKYCVHHCNRGFLKGGLKSSNAARCHRLFVAHPESGGGSPLQITLSQHDAPESLEVKSHSGFIPSMTVFSSKKITCVFFPHLR